MIQSLKNNRYSAITIVVVTIVLLFQGLKFERNPNINIIRHDVVSYYAYLPAVFIYKDLSFNFVSELPDDFPGDIWTHTSPNGKKTLKLTMGVAVLNLPFFVLAHIAALIFKIDPNGYSAPYQLSILFAAIFYLFLAMLFIRNTLLRYFSDLVVSITLLIIVLGTNLYYYSVVEPGMSHVYSFFLFSGFLYFTINWYSKPSWFDSIMLGIFLGLIILVRPSNIVVALLFLIFGQKSIKDRIELLWSQNIKILTIGIIAFLLISLQFIYWKFSAGKWIYNSYGNEGFYFNHPEIIGGLFSYRKGWLVYTPVMVFALIGFIFLRKKIPELFLPILLYFILNLFVVFSWWCWWYGGSFGARPLIETYALLSVPLALVIDQISRRTWIVKLVGFLAMVFLIYLNIFQSRQYRTSQIHWDSMSKELYWEVFLNEDWPDNYKELLDPPDYESALQGKRSN